MADPAQLAALNAMRTKLQAALFSGVLRVTYADRTVQYQTTAELRSSLRQLEEQIGVEEIALGLTPAVRRPRTVYVSGSKGL